MNDWFRLAFTGPIVRRATRYGLGVGSLLIVINHGDAILHHDLSAGRLLRMALTMTVPYTVSTASAVAALRDRKNG